MFYYNNIPNITWDTMHKYFIRMFQLLYGTCLHLKNCCLSEIQIWLSILYFIWQLHSCLISVFNHFPWLFLGLLKLSNTWFRRPASFAEKNNFCFELRKLKDFHNYFVMLLSNIFLGLSLFIKCYELTFKSLFLI